MLFTGAYVGIAIIVVLAIVILLKARVRWGELAHMREDMAQLSEDVKHLMIAEQRRILMELNSPQNKKSPKNEKNESNEEELNVAG